MHPTIKKFVIAIFLMVASILTGVIGFMTIEKDYTLSEAFYMTIITISTVGYAEIKPLSEGGRLFVSFYILTNLAFFAYLVSLFTRYIFEGELNKIYSRIMIGRELKQLKNHIILCGFGRNGRRAALELKNSRKKFVIIENNEAVLERFPDAKKNYSFVIGDATQDEVLKDAGIERATDIITTLPSDSNNVFITLTAKELNPSIKIISRASDENVEKKLIRAGAHHIVMPDALGGFHMAHIITKPFIVEFVEMLSGFGDSEYMLDEISFYEMKSEYRDKSIAELDIRKETAVTVFGYRDNERGLIFNPSPQIRIRKDAVLIIMGHESALRAFKQRYTRHFKLR